MAKTLGRTQQQRREAAQATVMEGARQVFAENGYQQASLEEIAARCGLTTRPVYHYFGNKQGLFAAVTVQLEQELAQQVAHALQQPDATLMAGWQAFMQMCERQDFRRIVLLDAPNVLGRARWHDSDVVKLAQQVLQHYLPQTTAIHSQLIIRMLLVALAEAALVIAESDDTGAFIQAANELVEQLLAQLKHAAPADKHPESPA